jgi:hypothetical protein
VVSSAVATPAPVSAVDGLPAATDRRWRRRSVIVGGLFVLSVALVGAIAAAFAGGDSTAASAANNLGQLAMALFATVAAGAALTRLGGLQHRAWLLVTIACGCWAIGQLVWCYREVFLQQEIPEVSLSDPFFWPLPR